VALLAQYNSGYAVAGYIFVSAIVSLAATLLLPDYTNKDIAARERVTSISACGT
jgi:hypothetical protein